MRLIVIVFVIALILGGMVVGYDWGCISSCMMRGGLYEECVKRCGG